MLKSKELRRKAWAALKGNYWTAFFVTLVLGLLVSIGTSLATSAEALIDAIGMVDPAEMDATMEIGALVVSGIALVMAIIGLIISIFVGSPASVGLANFFIKNTDSKPAFAEGFSGFKISYKRNVGTLLLMGIKLALWTCLFIIPGIIKSFEYAIIPYIIADNPEMTSKEAFKKAREMMKGNKWRLFKLDFSFIGWGLLCVVTMGIGTLFLIPYINAATAEFYVELKNK